MDAQVVLFEAQGVEAKALTIDTVHTYTNTAIHNQIIQNRSAFAEIDLDDLI
jgi:hypothetical protein